MIISDQHRFILVHIPKCAGVSVKKALRPLDDSKGGYSRIADHPTLGRIHFAHIPIGDLKAHFPGVFEKLKSYCSVALVRDPVDRFASGIFQRAREFKGTDQSAITPRAFAREAEDVMNYLDSASGRLPLEYIHFSRQRDFVFDGDEQVVANVFRLDQLDLAAALIAGHTGVEILRDQRLNPTVELRAGGMHGLVRLVRAPYAAVVPLALRMRIRSALISKGFYEAPKLSIYVPPGSSLAGFIRAYYAADFELYERSRCDPRSRTIAA